MTAEELKKIIARGETLCVEFKSDKQKLSDRDLVEAVVAMANTDGGLLLEGVEDNGTVTGLHKTHRGCGTPTALIANRTTPSLHVMKLFRISKSPAFAILSRLRDKHEIVMQGNRKSARYVRPPHAPACNLE